MNRQVIQTTVEAQELVFLGVVRLDVEEDFGRYQAWLADGRQAGMQFLENYQELRQDPRRLLPEARSAILFALPYALGEVPDGPKVAQYAQFKDYHRVLWDRGEVITKLLWGDESKRRARVVVDSAPVLERALAASSSRGFIGKNTCFIHPDQGSFLLLGEILTTEDLVADDRTAPREFEVKSKEGGCGPCKQCQVACPTSALDKDYQIDARTCLSYWTIEHRGPIPLEFWPHLAEYYFGCDICQTSCPYNAKVGRRLPASLERREIPSLFSIATMDEREYGEFFGGTPLTRAKRSGLRRNALIAMYVTGDADLPQALEVADRDPQEWVVETRDQIREFLSDRRGAGGEEILPRSKYADLNCFTAHSHPPAI